MAELADALVSGTSGRKAVEVQVLSRAIETDIKNKEDLKGMTQCHSPGFSIRKSSPLEGKNYYY